MKTRLGILGLGHLAQAIVKGLQAKGAEDFSFTATVRSADKAASLSKKFGFACHSDNQKLVKESDWLLLAVKPAQAKDILKALAQDFRKDQVIVSICASLTTQQLREWAGPTPKIVRTLPNTPSQVGEGMTALYAAEGLSGEQTQVCESIFRAVGRTAWLSSEDLMDAVTAVSGSGPAYVYKLVSFIAQAAQAQGVPALLANELAAQTFLGAAKMLLETGEDPDKLAQAVATPGGCTIEGLKSLESSHVKKELGQMFDAIHRRAVSLRSDTL